MLGVVLTEGAKSNACEAGTPAVGPWNSTISLEGFAAVLSHTETLSAASPSDVSDMGDSGMLGT